MDTNRITINNVDLSTATVERTTEISGLTVIKAPKGPIRPVRVSSDNLAKIQDIFGSVSEDYPEIYEAVTFNKGYDTYISAPYTSETQVPRAFITNKGVFVHSELVNYDEGAEKYALDNVEPDTPSTVLTVPKNEGSYLFDTRSCKDLIPDFDNVDKDGRVITYSKDRGLCIHTGCKGIKDKLESITTLRLTNLPFKLNNKNFIDLTIDVENQKLTIEIATSSGSKIVEVGSFTSNSTSESLIYIPGGTEEGITYTTYFSKALIDSYFSEPRYCEALRSYWLYPLSEESDIKVYGIIYPKYPSARTLHIDFKPFDSVLGYGADKPSSRNLLKMTAYEDGAFHDASHAVEIVGSLEKNAVDSQGSVVSFNSSNISYNEQELVCVYPIHSFTNVGEILNPSINQLPGLIFEGGIRGLEVEGATEFEKDVKLHNLGWDFINQNPEDYTSVDIMFEAQRHEVVNETALKTGAINEDIFFSLSKSESFKTTAFRFNYTVQPSIVENLTEKLGYTSATWNVLNEGVVELATGSKFISPLTGAVALMDATILEHRWGGVAPMWLNSGSPAMGGQISASGVTKLRYKYTKEQLSRLDDLNFNPVILDRTYGLMVVGQKTCNNGDITDWSYIGHVASFLNFEKEVKETVMVPQIGKPNNDYYRTLRKEQVNQLLVKRLTGNGKIWTEASVDTSTADGVNDLAAQRARKFVIQVKVKPSTFSEEVILNFMNIDQGLSV